MSRLARIAVLALAVSIAIPASAPADEPPDTADRRAQAQSDDPLLFGFDFLPYVGTSTAAPDRRRVFSLNFIGLSGGIDVFELGFANIATGPVDGIQAAGVANVVTSDVNLAQFSGAANVATGTLRGLQGAGTFNLNMGRARGIQAAGALNVNGARLGGVQAAGALNANAGSTNGVQASGGLNVGMGRFRGIQATGGLNVNTGRFRGAQIAGGFNVNTGDFEGVQAGGGFNANVGHLEGAQIAGGFNGNIGPMDAVQVSGGFNANTGPVQGLQVSPHNFAGGHVDGAQIGVVNAAPSSDASLGLIGIFWRGFLQLEAFGSEEGLASVGLRHGSGSFYNLYNIGTRLFAHGSAPLTWGLGLGWRTDLAEDIEFSADVALTSLVGGADDWAWSTAFELAKLRPMLALDLADDLAIFGGPTLSVLRGTEELDVRDYAPVPAGEIDTTEDAPDFAFWPGFTAGVRLF